MGVYRATLLYRIICKNKQIKYLYNKNSMRCFQKQIDRNLCSFTYGEIRHVEIPCPTDIVCMEDPCQITIDDQSVTYQISTNYNNSLTKSTLMDTISVSHYCIDGITIFATETLQIFSNGIGSYYTKTVNVVLTGITC